MEYVVTKDGEITYSVEDISSRSSEVEDLLSHQPSFLIRSGTILLLWVLVFTAVIAWFIQYPDVVQTAAIIGSENAAVKINSNSDGIIKKLLVKNDDIVTEGSLLAYIDAAADHNNVIRLHQTVDSIKYLLESGRTDKALQYLPSHLEQGYDRSLGELQPIFQTFMNDFAGFNEATEKGFFIKKRQILLKELTNLKVLYTELLKQREMLEEDIDLSEKTLKANETLLDQKVISPLEYRNERSKHLSKQMMLPQINTTMISNMNEQSNKIKEIASLENEIGVQKNKFLESVQSLSSAIKLWEQKYLIRAPKTGNISFTRIIEENHPVRQSETLFWIYNGASKYFVEMYLPQQDLGKIKKGQRVTLKLAAYPEEQFGKLQGNITYISPTGGDSGFFALAVLDKGFVTNRNKQLEYKSGLEAKAEIVTQEFRLLERLYFNLKKQIARN